MHILPSFQHIINPKLKNIYLSFSENGELIIKSPKVSNKEIERILIKKSNWIEEARKKVKLKKGKYKTIEDGTNIYLLGNNYSCNLIKFEKRHSKLNIINNQIEIYYSTYNNEKFISLVDNMYKEKAKEIIPDIVKRYSQIMNLKPLDIKFRKTKRQWGSCSSNNVLSFNTMVMKLPIDVIEYIVIHELAHIKHKNHQKSFWNLVEQFMSDYKDKITTLKEYST